jgi:zinc protease
MHEGRLLGSGLSHLLEHLIFKGTPRRSGTELAQEIQELGGHLNAYTSYDRTVYHLDLPSVHVESALDILNDALLNPAFPAEEFEREKDVIRREFAMGDDNPDVQFWKTALGTVFSVHPIRHPIIGHIDLFNALRRDHVVEYFQERYAPQNIVLVVVGDIDLGRLIDYLEGSLGKWPRRLSPGVALMGEPRQIAPRRVRRTFATELSRVAFLYRIPGFDDPDMPALEVLAMLAGEGLSAWLYRYLVEERGVAQEITAFTYAPCDVGVWGAEAYCLPDLEGELIGLLRESISSFGTRLISDQDLIRIKNQILAQHYHQLRTFSGQASGLGQGWLLARDPLLSYGYIDKIASVTAEQIRQVARRYLRGEQENVVVLSPRGGVGGGGSKGGKVEGGDAGGRDGMMDGAVTFYGGHRPPYIYVREARLPLFGVDFTILGGVLAESKGEAGLARLTIESLVKSTQRHDGAGLAAAIENVGGQLHTVIGNNAATVSIDSLCEHEEGIAELFAEILMCPKFEDQEVETEKRKQLAALAAEMDDPMNVARRRLRACLYGDHAYARSPLGTVETVSAFTRDEVRAFWDRLLGTWPFVFAVHAPVGDLSGLRFLSELGWAGCDSDWGLSEVCGLRPRPLEETLEHREYHPKDQGILMVGFPTVPVGDGDRLVLDLVAEALSDMGSRLFVKIREEEGLAYFVGASHFGGLAAGHFAFYLGTDPAKLEGVEEMLMQEIGGLVDGGLKEEELRRARAKLISLYTMDMQNASAVAHQATLNHLYGLGFDYHVRRLGLVGGIDLDRVNEVIGRYLHPSLAHVTVTLSPLHGMS